MSTFIKKTSLLSVLISAFIFMNANSQTIKTGDDESSIIFGGTTIGFDVGKSELSFTTNNYSEFKNKASGLLWGVEVSGKNSDGLASFLNSSELTPSSSIRFNLGFFSSKKEDITNHKPVLRKKLINKEKQLTAHLDTTLLTTLKVIVRDYEGDICNCDKIVLTDKINSVISYFVLKNEFKSISKNLLLSEGYRKLAGELFLYMDTNDALNDLSIVTKELLLLNSEALSKISNTRFKKFTVYSFLELSKENFTTFSGWDSTNVSDSFQRNEFDGTKLGIAGNIHYKGDWYFGGRIFYELTNNTSLLNLTNYKYQEEHVFGNQQYTQQSEISAYNGSFKEVGLVRFDIDVARFIPFGENFLILNTYLRNTSSRDKEILASKADIGISSSFFKSKGNFLGGIYLELPDFDQNQEAQKETPELEPWHKRLSFGIYTKISLSGFDFLPTSRQ